MRGKSSTRSRVVRVSRRGSMRPALCAREIRSRAIVAQRVSRCFNEARALCAGNRDKPNGAMVEDVLASMRPALCAREIQASNGAGRSPNTGFNEARALCAGNQNFGHRGMWDLSSFNEARALCAGNRPATDTRCAYRRRSFNEARALCAGNQRVVADDRRLEPQLQ